MEDAAARENVPTRSSTARRFGVGVLLCFRRRASDARAGRVSALVGVRDVGRALHSLRLLEAVGALHGAVGVQVEDQRTARAGPDAEPALRADASARRKRYDVAFGRIRHCAPSRTKRFDRRRDAGNGRLTWIREARHAWAQRSHLLAVMRLSNPRIELGTTPPVRACCCAQ